MSIHDKIKDAKLALLDMHYNAHVGHVGGNLSCIDILMTLFHEVMGPDDQFILSKGHSAGALYVTLASKGLIDPEELSTFHKDGTRLPGHPAPHTFVPFATGSLGHGLSLAAGLALAKTLRGDPGRVFCVLSDGELQEGSTYEALQFAKSHDLPVTAIIDANGFQGFGTTEKIMGRFPEGVWRESAHCWSIGGHDPTSLIAVCQNHRGGFLPILCYTRKGHGVPGFEDTLASHYTPLTQEQYDAAKVALYGGTPPCLST